MVVKSAEDRPLKNEDDLVQLRTSVKRVVALLNFSLINQTKIITATSELARNTLEHGGGGRSLIQVINEGDRVGVRLVFEDTGPGITDIDQALEDGYTSGKGMGLGLGGARRLMDQFLIQSAPGEGTTVTVTKWQEKI